MSRGMRKESRGGVEREIVRRKEEVKKVKQERWRRVNYGTWRHAKVQLRIT